MLLDCAGRELDLSRPQVMGVLNVTPDSFSDGGRYETPQAALEQARRMVEEGATIIDIGGESTRPGARAVGIDEELQRVIPVIERLRDGLAAVISIDTSKPEVMQAAVAAGAGLINDVNALRAEGALECAAGLEVPVCLMHMQGEPRTMQAAPHYDDVVADIQRFFRERVDSCEAHGIARERLLLDPGFGFGKTVAHNLTLLKHLAEFKVFGLPILVGLSRKSMIGAVLEAEVGHRLAGSLAVASLAVWNGAAIVRAHDVRATVDALRMVQAVIEA